MVFRRIVASMMRCLGVSKKPKQLAASSSQIYESSSPATTSTVDPLVVVPPRIRLGDGRYLAYKESGVPKSKSNYRIIIVHGFGSSKEMNFMAPQVKFTPPLFFIFCSYLQI